MSKIRPKSMNIIYVHNAAVSHIADKARLMPSFSSIISVSLSTPYGEE